MLEHLYRRVLMALRSVLWRRTADRELDDELRFHAEQMEELAIARGEDPSDPRWRAGRQIARLDVVKEACRDMRTLRPVGDFLQDLRFGARQLARGRGFAAVAVASLALGIGATSSIFSVINAVVLRPLPVADPHELFIAQVTEPHEIDRLFSSSNVERASALLAGRAEIAAYTSTESVLVGARGTASPPTAARLQLVAGDFFGTLRQRAQLGRLLGPSDNRHVGQHPVAVISDRFWNNWFGRAANLVGSELIVNGATLTIVGVAAPEFFGATVERQAPDIWAPAAMQAVLRFAGNFERTGGDIQKPWPSQPEFSWLQVVIRAPAGRAPTAAEAMTLAVNQQNPPSDRQDSSARPVTLVPGSRGFSPIRSELTTPLLVLLLMVALLLLISCANIASLLLARAMGRGREIAIRLSMGAGRGRLIRQLLTESLLLACVGGVLGLTLAYWGSTTLLTLLTDGVPASGIDVTPDWRVVSVTLATSVATALVFGLLPAVRGTRVALAESLKAQTRTVIGSGVPGRRAPVGQLLIAGQMAFALLLLLVASLFARSLQVLTQVDVGYDRDHLLVARIDPRAAGYAVTEVPALSTRVTERLTSLPGVVAVSLSSHGPFSGSRSRGDFQIEGYTPGPDELLMKHSDWVTSDYFRSVGLTITQGRAFGPEDSARSRRVSIINETMARRYFPGRNPIGMRWGDDTNFAVTGIEIVGVVEDARYNDVKAESLSMSYLPAVQSERYLRSIEVRTSGQVGAAAMASTLRDALREAEPRLAVGPIESLDDRIVRSIRVERLLGGLTMTFGGAALVLACLGLYGTISNAVRRRTAELGMRVALGADRASVQWLIVREALLPVLLGAAVGLPLAFVAARALRGLLYRTAPSDPIAYGTAAGVLLVVCALAAYVPAWRASRLDPIAALRSE
jgi:predicted permease